MDLDRVSFPALVVAEDGWVEEFTSREALSTMTHAAFRKYSKRRLLIYDSRDQAWQVDRLTKANPENTLARLWRMIANSKVKVCLELKPIADTPVEVTQSALMAAVDADDDILTQFTDASELKRAIGQAHSFEALRAALKEKKAI